MVSETNLSTNGMGTDSLQTFGGANRISGNSYPFTGKHQRSEIVYWAVSRRSDYGRPWWCRWSVGTIDFCTHCEKNVWRNRSERWSNRSERKISGLTKENVFFGIGLKWGGIVEQKRFTIAPSLSNSNADSRVYELILSRSDNRIPWWGRREISMSQSATEIHQ